MPASLHPSDDVTPVIRAPQHRQVPRDSFDVSDVEAVGGGRGFPRRWPDRAAIAAKASGWCAATTNAHALIWTSLTTIPG